MINKMDKSCRCCVFLVWLAMVLAAWCAVAEILSKSVCIGDSVQLFQNIILPGFKMKVSLYKDGGGTKVPIAMWLKNASGTFDNILRKYKSKVLLENGTITLRNVQYSDQAVYSIEYDPPSRFETNEAQIRALAPPDKPCKPKLQQVDNFLIALLDDLDKCGTPVVSIHWMEYPGISNNSTAVLELKPGKDACTYYACIEGEALRCTRKSTAREYCEYINVTSSRKENIPIPSSIPIPSFDSWPTTILILVIVVVVILVLVIVIGLPIILWKLHKCPGRVCSNAERRDEGTTHGQYNDDPAAVHLGDQEEIEMEEIINNPQP